MSKVRWGVPRINMLIALENIYDIDKDLGLALGKTYNEIFGYGMEQKTCRCDPAEFIKGEASAICDNFTMSPADEAHQCGHDHLCVNCSHWGKCHTVDTEKV